MGDKTPTPIVSILTPVFNGWEFLPDCAQGVFNQEGIAREWLIGINGHGDSGGRAASVTAALLAGSTFAGPPPPDCLVRPFVLPAVRGKVETMNALAAAATAPWIAVLDCDDVWAPRKLAAQLAGPAADADVIGTHCLYFGDIVSAGPRLPSGWISPDAWRTGNPLINSSVIMRREFAHWEDRFGLDDYDLWIRLSLAGKRMYNVAEPLTYHRIHASSAFNGKGGQDVEGLRRFYSCRQ